MSEGGVRNTSILKDIEVDPDGVHCGPCKCGWKNWFDADSRHPLRFRPYCCIYGALEMDDKLDTNSKVQRFHQCIKDEFKFERLRDHKPPL